MKDKKCIDDPWFAEFDHERYDGKLIFNLVNGSTGEIRQKVVTVDFTCRRIFENELKSWGDIKLRAVTIQ